MGTEPGTFMSDQQFHTNGTRVDSVVLRKYPLVRDPSVVPSRYRTGNSSTKNQNSSHSIQLTPCSD